jgi:hypothetical protein
LGIGREMHCIYNNCKHELACYVKNLGRRDGTPLFGDKAEAEEALQSNKPFATVAMVERLDMAPDAANRVFFAVYEHISGDPENTQLALSAPLDRKGYNTSIPGNCLQCHGINSRYTAHARHEVRRAFFLPFDLDAFEFFSNEPRVSQESAFRAQNRMVVRLSGLSRLPDARQLVRGWYNGDLFTGTFNGKFVPKGWSGVDEPYPPASPQVQLYRKVYAQACRTCHISYEPAPTPPPLPGQMPFPPERVDLQFGTYQQFAGISNLKEVTCGSVTNPTPMPNAEQTLLEFWRSEARAHLFAQTPHTRGFGDCAPIFASTTGTDGQSVFSKEIHPILARNCTGANCHSQGSPAANFFISDDVATYKSLLEATTRDRDRPKYIVPMNKDASLLFKRITEMVEALFMPRPPRPDLRTADTDLPPDGIFDAKEIGDWIDSGAVGP